MSRFPGISDSEYKALKDAVAYITILVAGADDNIDEDEKDWAEKLTQIRSYASDDKIREFYEDVGVDFSAVLHHFIEELPNDVSSRNQIIESRIHLLNPILAKLDSRTGSKIYQSYTSFAEHVAKASGGFMRFFSVSSEEKKVIGLSMLDEIIHEEE